MFVGHNLGVKIMKTHIIAYAIGISAVALFFQNCGKVSFSSANSTRALTTQTVPNSPSPTPGPTNITNGYGSNTNTTVTNSDTNTNTNTDVDTDTDPDAVGSKPSCAGHDTNYGDDSNSNDDNNYDHDDPGTDDANSTQWVECDLGSPSVKIVLTETGKGLDSSQSNAETTRVCMSPAACESINTYDQGAQAFPGSNGTCHDAELLTDAQVASLLKNNGGLVASNAGN